MIVNADCQTFPHAGEFDCMITDPPYREHVHANATSLAGGVRQPGVAMRARKNILGFAHLSDPLRAAIAGFSRNVRRWSLVYTDIETAHLWRAAMPYIRTVPWVRWSMPQLSGDRPPQGFEEIILGHNAGAKRWNGPGNLTHLAHPALRGEGKHKTEKPLDQMLDLVSWFTDPGESVLDPCVGSGTTALACRLLGRECYGIEIDPCWAARAAEREKGPLSERDRERVRRWLDSDTEPVTQCEGPAQARAARRAADKARVQHAAR